MVFIGVIGHIYVIVRTQVNGNDSKTQHRPKKQDHSPHIMSTNVNHIEFQEDDSLWREECAEDTYNEETSFLSLPAEVKLLICRHLDFHTLVALSETCTFMYRFLKQEHPQAWHFKHPPKWGRSIMICKPARTPARHEVEDLLRGSGHHLGLLRHA